jgi:hypothetical protein
MVDVGMGKDKGINAGRFEGKVAVDFECIFATALEQAAVEENLGPINLDKMLRAGDGARCTVKCEFHLYPPVIFVSS